MAENLIQQNPLVSSPPAPEIAIRTMESDIKSVEQSGGAGPTPQMFSPGLKSGSVVSSVMQSGMPAEPQKIEAQLNVTGYTGPEQAIFKPTGTISAEPTSKGTFNKWRFTLIIAGVLIIIAIFWALGYFVIFPWLFPPQMPAVQ